jgi:hypothetical protein
VKYDILDLTDRGGAVTHTVKIKRGSLEVGPGHLSYIGFDDEREGHNYIALHSLHRWRYVNQTRASEWR